MDQVDRRQVMKLGAGAVVGAAAVSALPALKAEASHLPKIVAVGKVGFSRLWGTTIKSTKEYYYDSRGRRRVRYIRTRILKTKGLYIGTDKATLNKGGLCHWVGTPAIMSNGNCVLFGHRTSARGPLRNVHKIKLNDEFVLEYGGQTKTYRVVEPKTIIGSRDFAQAINWGDRDKSYVTLVACTKPNGSPTSTKFRFLVRAVAI